MYNILGIDHSGRKEVLGFYFAESEVLVENDLKERDILIACVKKLSYSYK